MKNTIKIITIFAFVALFFTACNKESNNNTNNQAHKARYEVISLEEEQVEISAKFMTKKEVDNGNSITFENETSTTPWKHEFLFSDDSFSFEAVIELNNVYGEEYKPIKISLYIDDKLVAEQQNEEHSFIIFNYFFYE